MARLSSPRGWIEANQAQLLADLGRIKLRLARQAHQKTDAAPAKRPPQKAFAGQPAALDHLVEAFGLSAFERDLLLLAAGMELDAAVAGLCAAAQSDATLAFPTFNLALTCLPRPHWSALSPDAPLRRWRLIELGPSPVLARAPISIDERILHFLIGSAAADPRLAALLEALPEVAADDLPPSQAEITALAGGVWAAAKRGPDLPIVQLCGAAADCLPVAAAIAGALGLGAAALPAARLPGDAAELDGLLRLWEREVALSNLGLLVIDCEETSSIESDAGRLQAAAIQRLLERATGPIILREREPRRVSMRAAVGFDVGHPTASEQLAAWRHFLGRDVPAKASLEATVAQFDLGLPTIRAIAAEARAKDPGGEDMAARIWDLCRRRLRSALDGLAVRVESNLGWDDLVLPEGHRTTLLAIAAQLRQRLTVQEAWGFAAKSSRGLGTSALFYGPSGTGKTLAAEVLANELGLDLYHIDLSRLMSKYIGETEANLRRVFDAAEENGAILLFDEADSLFGKRSEVKDSHDRYANIEVSYLLQRMERYRGLAILTTNMPMAIDGAMFRRIRFALQFPFPDPGLRADIWRKAFPAQTPVDKLDPEKLSRLEIAGGNIHTIALNAAFLAADAGRAVGMAHIEQAARAEYAKLERRLTAQEEAAWQ